jgi:hypothetical protein
MSIARAILVILTALSVALLPAAVASARPSAPVISAHADCCPPGQDCDKQSKRDCTKDAACALKCASVSAMPPASSEIASVPASFVELAPIHLFDLSPAPTPPSPPPRV